MPLITNTTVLYEIAELEARYGNAPHYQLTHLFITRGPGTSERLHEVLDDLEAKDLIVRDGRRHDGVHYAVTERGKRHLVRQDLRPAA